MAKKNNKKDKLPFHIVKDSQNLLKLKLKETINGVTRRYRKIPRKFLSSGIIIMGILIVLVIAVFITHISDSPDLSNSLDESYNTNLADVVIDEKNQLAAQTPPIEDISLQSDDFSIGSLIPDTQSEEEKFEDGKNKEEVAQTTINVKTYSQMAAGQSSEEENVKELEIIYPLRRQVGISNRPGWYFHPIFEKWCYHRGVDLRCKKGDLVMAVAPGKIVDIKEDFQEILLVTIDHGNDWTTVYGQLNHLSVKVGDSVVKGQQIGSIGQSETSIEPHLHFEICHNGEIQNPEEYL